MSALLLFAATFSAHSQQCADRISAERLKLSVEFLSGDICNGRRMGTPGAFEASCWIASQFDKAGLELIDSSRFQRFGIAGCKGCNVVGIRHGRMNHYILIGAHYDGLGVVGGNILPGADCNASGVAALCEVARALPRELAVGVIFVAFDGYNSSFAGAHAFADAHPELKISTMISLDILGGVSAPVYPGQAAYMIALGAKDYSSSMYWASYYQDITVYYDYYGSREFTDLFLRRVGDQTVFSKRKIATIVFTSGITMNTNKPSDTARTLDYDVFTRRTKTICRWLEIKTTGR